VEADLRERLVEDAPGGPHEGMALLVFLVAGLLAHQHDPRSRAAFAEDRLGGVFPERAVAAAHGSSLESAESATPRLLLFHHRKVNRITDLWSNRSKNGHTASS